MNTLENTWSKINGYLSISVILTVSYEVLVRDPNDSVALKEALNIFFTSSNSNKETSLNW